MLYIYTYIYIYIRHLEQQHRAIVDHVHQHAIGDDDVMSEPDAATESDDSVSAASHSSVEETNVGSHEPDNILDIVVPPSTAPMATMHVVESFEQVQCRLGVIEVNNQLYVRSSDGSCGICLGHIEFIHGANLSFKAVCANAAHVPPHGNTGKKARKCTLLVSATEQTRVKYERMLQWLLAGCGLCRLDHLQQSDEIRANFMRVH